MSEQFYAKTDQTYAEHIQAAYRAWRETVEEKMPLLRRLSQEYGFDLERFLKGSLLTIAVHDAGKMCEPFQEMIRAKREGGSFDLRKNYRHELLSFELAARAWSQVNAQEPLSPVPVEPLAVVGHHRPVDADLRSFDRERTLAPPRILEGGWGEAISLARQLFQRQGWELPGLCAAVSDRDPYLSLESLIGIEGVLGKLLQRDDPVRVRVLYVLVKGILEHADWHASGGANARYRLEVGPEEVTQQIEGRCLSRGGGFQGLLPFQEALRETTGNALAVAPTGSGKTEGSLMWALRNARDLGNGRVIYLLPTMVTANAIWERFSGILGEECVGLNHSGANVFLLGREEERQRRGEQA